MLKEPLERIAPICIAGMHRSGTSMTARILNLCGVYLGPQDGMLPPQADNPKGFWELHRFVDINEALLGRLGGAWDRPPAGPVAGTGADPDLAPLRLKALELAAEFRGREPWGFKDPRNSLTLAFWREVLGPLSVVICLRNPRDVVRSLEARGSTVDSAYRLWETHYRWLLRDTDDRRSIVVHYESFFADALAEARRLTGFLGLAPAEANLRAACGSIDTDLRRNVSSLDELIASGAPAGVVELYVELCRRAGPTCPVASDGPPAGTTAADVLAVRLDRMTARLQSLRERCARLDGQLEQERNASEALRQQALGWRALAERGDGVRRAWSKMTALLADRDPVLGIERHGAQILDDELLHAVRLYGMAARDEGEAAIALDLERLASSIAAALAETGPVVTGAPPSSAGTVEKI